MSQLNPSQSSGFHKRMRNQREYKEEYAEMKENKRKGEIPKNNQEWIKAHQEQTYSQEEMENIPISGIDRKEQGINERKYQRTLKARLKAKKENFKDKDTFSEKDVNLAKRRLNDGKIKKQDEIFGDAEGNYTNKKLSDDQQRKGKDWLMNQWKSPTGVERKNNPYGYREQEILTNFDRIELKEYHDISRYGQRPYYVPLYQAYGKDGDSMEYYVDSKGINIVG